MKANKVEAEFPVCTSYVVVKIEFGCCSAWEAVYFFNARDSVTSDIREALVEWAVPGCHAETNIHFTITETCGKHHSCIAIPESEEVASIPIL